jgi:hypothetical protein
MLFQFIQEINNIEITKKSNNTINLIVNDDEKIIEPKSILTNIIKNQLGLLKDVIEQQRYEGNIPKANMSNDIDLVEMNFFKKLENSMDIDLNNDSINHNE